MKRLIKNYFLRKKLIIMALLCVLTIVIFISPLFAWSLIKIGYEKQLFFGYDVYAKDFNIINYDLKCIENMLVENEKTHNLLNALLHIVRKKRPPKSS